jgi:hypothetical protein
VTATDRLLNSVKVNARKANVRKGTVRKGTDVNGIGRRANVASVRKGGVRKANVPKRGVAALKVDRRADRVSVGRRTVADSAGCFRIRCWQRLIRMVMANCLRRKLTGPSLL